MNLDDIAPARTNHAVFIGQNGSGKTFAAQAFLSLRKYVVVYDAKGLIRWKGYQRYTKLELAMKSKSERIIYAPNRLEARDPHTWSIFFEWIYQRRNTTLYIDEVYSVVRGQDLPVAYFDLLTRGRELNVEVYTSTQRPRLLPNTILSESILMYVFYLQMESDKKKVEGMIPITAEQISALPPRYFYVYKSRERKATGPHILRAGKRTAA